MSHGVRLALLGLVPLLTLLIGLFLFREILLPFLVGMAAAYLLDPAADRLQRLGLRPHHRDARRSPSASSSRCVLVLGAAAAAR